MRRHISLSLVAAGTAVLALGVVSPAPAAVGTGKRGPSTTINPYVLPRADGVEITSLLTVGDLPAANGYRMVGIPDGLGARNSATAGKLELLMNHELAGNQGIVRAHGQTGAFVSNYTIDAPLPRELLGEHVRELLPQPEAEALVEACAAALDGEERSLDLVSAEHGYALWLRSSPLRGEDGRIGAMLIVQDVSARVARNREIGEAQERCRRAFDDAPIGMAVAELDGRFVEVNQALCTITGYTAAELTGATFSSITHPDDLDADFAVIRALLAGERTSSVDEKRYLPTSRRVDRCGSRAASPSCTTPTAGRCISSTRSRTSPSAGASRASCATSPTTTR